MEKRVLVHGRWLTGLLGVSLVLTLVAPSAIQAQAPTCTDKVEDFATYTACMGVFPDPTYSPGRPYHMQVPTNWNGTLVLIGQGYAYPGSPPPSTDQQLAGETLVDYSWILSLDPFKKWLLHNGYAIAGSWAGTGWTVEGALRYQTQTLDVFASSFGAPTRTIAYGGSLGGIISAGLIQQHPERFAGALSVAGVLAGSVGAWNEALDFAFVVQRLLGSTLEIVHITSPGTPFSGNFGRALQVLNTAQGTAQGRARIALACAVMDLPGWFDARIPEPALDDYPAREFNQFLWAENAIVPLAFGLGRVDIEQRAGGNPSWNLGVNYQAQLEKSTNYAEVVALYQGAGLSLEDDLARLKAARRIAPDPAAIKYLSDNIDFSGDLGGVPILTVHTTDDGLITNQHEFAYRLAVDQARNAPLLRQAFVHRAGHGFLTMGELVAAFQALIHRMDTGRWEGSASPEALNAAALALGPSYNVLDFGGGNTVATAPAYLDFDPAPFLRPYGLADGEALERRGPAPEPETGDPVVSTLPVAGQPKSDGRGVVPAIDAPGTTPSAATSDANGNSLVATRPLAAWPLPYRGGSLNVSFSLRAGVGSNAQVAIYDLSGRLVRLLSGAARDGFQSLEWDGRDARGIAVGTGVYFLRAMGDGRSAQLKFVVLR